MITPQYLLDISDEIIVDNFAGGGGASTGIELALGRHVDVAINHDPEAVAMHQANHPQTRHHCESVWEVNPREVEPGRKIGLLWLSPDCKHFSKAKGGKPVEKKIRGLAWVALRWVALRKPRRLILENVEEFITWGPLVEDANGNMRPCPKRKGREFNAFVNALRSHGYAVEWKELRASDHGTPTIRKRLFLVARCDGQPIVWPEQTHADPKSDAVKRGHLKPWRTAAECIDWTLPCPSIFLSKEEGRAIGVNRPLADATMRRIARGIMRYVVNTTEPFIVRTDHASAAARNGVHALREPVRTICASGGLAIVQPFISTYYGDKRPGDVRGIRMDEPLHTQTTENRHAVVSAFMAKHYGGVVGHGLHGEPLHTVTSSDHNSLVTANLVRHFGQSTGSAATEPVGTITAGGMGKTGIVTSNLIKLRGTNIGQPDTEPLHTVSAQGQHFAEVRAFLVKYYGTDQDPQLREPLHTVTTKDRYGLVTVGEDEYAIADIGLRMLAPRELFRAQGFPEHYIIDRGLHIDEHGSHHWKPLTKSAQVRMCGNSVCPPLAAALVRANCADMITTKEPKRRQA